jgi:hypothetical protein
MDAELVASVGPCAVLNRVIWHDMYAVTQAMGIIALASLQWSDS